MSKRPLYVPGRRPFYNPDTGNPFAAESAALCACCETLQQQRYGYVFCACCLPVHDCNQDVETGAVGVLVEDFPAGPGVYRAYGGSCYRVIGPPVLLPPGTNVLRPGHVAGPFATCEECPGDCRCATPSELAISFSGWETRPQAINVDSLGFRFWAEAVFPNPNFLNGGYIIPADLSDFGNPIVLATFPDAVIVVGPYGEWGRNDLELVLFESSVDRCLGGDPPLCLWKWRLRAVWGVRPTNARTTNNRAVVGPHWPLGVNYEVGVAPYAFRYGAEVVVPCDEGGTWCLCPPEYTPGFGYGFNACPGYDPELGPDGGCAAWVNWPGCPGSPQLYRFHKAGCVAIAPVV